MTEWTEDVIAYKDGMLKVLEARHKHTVIYYVVAFFCFGAGLLALYLDGIIIAIILLALAAYFNQESKYQQLLAEITSMQWSMALLIIKHNGDLRTITPEYDTETDEKH